MNDKKSLKYPLPGDIDLTEDEVFRNREFHIFEPSGKKLLPWQVPESNWFEYDRISNTSFGTVNLSITTSSNNTLVLDDWVHISTNNTVIGSQRLNTTSDPESRLTLNSNAGYTVTYKFNNGLSYTDKIIVPTEYHTLNVDNLYEKLPFSPFRYSKEPPVYIHKFKHAMYGDREYDMSHALIYLDFKNNDMKYNWAGSKSNSLFRAGGQSVRKWFDEKDESVYEIIIRNPNKESFEDDLVLSSYEPYNELEHIDMGRFPWETRRHGVSNRLVTIANRIDDLRTTWLNTSSDDIVVAVV